MTLFGELTDQKDGRLTSQNNHLVGARCQVLLVIRDWDRDISYHGGANYKGAHKKFTVTQLRKVQD